MNHSLSSRWNSINYNVVKTYLSILSRALNQEPALLLTVIYRFLFLCCSQVYLLLMLMLLGSDDPLEWCHALAPLRLRVIRNLVALVLLKMRRRWLLLFGFTDSVILRTNHDFIGIGVGFVEFELRISSCCWSTIGYLMMMLWNIPDSSEYGLWLLLVIAWC